MKSKWDRMLLSAALIIVLLISTILCLSYKKSGEYDMSNSYETAIIKDNEYDTAAAFASDLIVCSGYVSLEGYSLSNLLEKALLFNLEDRSALFANGIYDKIYPASITKIMTAILALKYGNMDQCVTMVASDFDLEEGSQTSNMQAGDEVTMGQLLRLVLVYSANDAANAIARTISGSVDEFVVLMNSEALSYGMLKTNFVNPHGLHDDNHYTCAYDVYIMLEKAMDYSLFTEIIRLSSYTLDVTRGDEVISYYYEATDEYLTGVKSTPDDVFIWGGKTGTTSEAGACLALIVQNVDGLPFIAVIMNCDTKAQLYNDMSELLIHVNDV